jgi:hypothetical protein
MPIESCTIKRGARFGCFRKKYKRRILLTIALAVVLGDISLGESIIPVENLAETLQVAFNAGAKREDTPSFL